MRATTTGGGSRSESDQTRAKKREETKELFFSTRTNRRRRSWFRARTALALSSAFTSCTRVLNRPNAQMCCWSSHVTSSALPSCGDERAHGRGSAGEIGRHMIFSREGRTRLKGRRARSTERSARGGRPGAREAREKSRGITTHAHVGFLLDESRTHHSRAARSAKRTTDDGSFACFAEFFIELNGKTHLNTEHN